MTSTVAGATRNKHVLKPLLGIAACVVLVDQLAKHWAVTHLNDGHADHMIWTLQFNLSFNTGMAFSKGTAAGPLIAIVSLIVVCGICYWNMTEHRPVESAKLLTLASGLVVGGALGNVTDRLFRGDAWLRGGVVDFIDLQWWPVFNVADAGITIGGVLLVMRALSMSAKEPVESENV